MDDVLTPEVYWMDFDEEKEERCYRKNPSRNNYQLSKHDTTEDLEYTAPERDTRPKKTYDELEDEACGLDISDDEDEDGSNYIVEKAPNGYITQCDNIAGTFFNVIIGQKGSTKKRIEVETNTKIVVPRVNEKGDIVIRGVSKRDVKAARRRMDLMVFQARFKRDLTHFLYYPLNKPSVMKKYNEFKENVLQDFGSSIGVDEGLFQTPEKLHLTICMLVLVDPRERTELTNALANLSAEVKNLVGTKVHTIGLHGIEIMNDDPSAVDVLYAKCSLQDNTLQNLANFVAKRLDSTGYCKKNRTENVKLHCTLMNTRRAETSQPVNNGGGGGGGGRNHNKRETFDARDILEKYGSFSFGTVEIDSIVVATRFTKDDNGGYKTLTSLPLT